MRRTRVSRSPKPILCGLLLLVLSVPCARAATAVEVSSLTALGAMVTLDNQFTPSEVSGIIAAGPGRVTVLGQGFLPGDARRFLTGGAMLVLDGTYSPQELLSLCQQGHQRVIVDPAGLSADLLHQVRAAGSHIKPDEGGASYGEKMRTLGAGGQVVVDRKFTAGQVANLVAAGKVRVHVMSMGFRPSDVDLFVRGGAIVWVDRTLPAADARRLAQLAALRLVVLAEGFSQDDLRAIAQARSQLVFTRQRESGRTARFDRLHAGSDPGSRSWRGGLIPR